MSIWPNFLSTASTSFSASRRTVWSETAQATRDSQPLAISAAAVSSSAWCRLVMKTSAPASTNPRAMALPRPLLPPVTSATRPFRLNSVLCIDLPLQLAYEHEDRLNVRAGLPPVNQPIPGAHQAPRVCPLDTAAQNGTILQIELNPL